MNVAQIEIQLIACLVAVACAVPGVFLVLRKMALISDAISHAILPGIVIGFFITQDLNSPLLILLASITGVITVFLVEYIQKTGLVKEDTAIGLVFPALFSLGVILIAQNANDIHLDTDAVLLGELAFAPFERFIFNGYDLGAKSLWISGSICLINISLLLTFYKELKLSTFDIGLASSLGFSPVIIHYGLMSVASVTSVSAFDSVGAVLVVALTIAPAASAYLITHNLKKMLFLSAVFGILSAISGYWLAHFLNASIAGSITLVLALIFLSLYLFSRKTGVIAVNLRSKQQKREVMLLVLLLHLNNHKEKKERHIKHLREHINWQKVSAKKVVDLALSNNMIAVTNNILSLTKKGNQFTNKAMDYIIKNENEGIEDIKDDFFLFRG